MAVGIFLFHAAERAVSAYNTGGAISALASAGQSHDEYLKGLIPVVPSAISAYESWQRAAATKGPESAGAATDTYVATLQALTQAVGLFGGLKAGAGELDESGSLARVIADQRGVAITVNTELETTLAEAMKDEPGAEFAETWKLERIDGPHALAGEDPALPGATRAKRFYATFLEEMTGDRHTISFNYDQATDRIGTVKFSSGKP